MDHSLQLKQIEPNGRVVKGQGQQQKGIGRGIEYSRLNISPERMAGIGVGVPQRRLEISQSLPLKKRERQEMVREVSVGEGAQAQ